MEILEAAGCQAVMTKAFQIMQSQVGVHWRHCHRGGGQFQDFWSLGDVADWTTLPSWLHYTTTTPFINIKTCTNSKG